MWYLLFDLGYNTDWSKPMSEENKVYNKLLVISIFCVVGFFALSLAICLVTIGLDYEPCFALFCIAMIASFFLYYWMSSE